MAGKDREEKSQTEQLLEKLEQGVKEMFESDRYRKYLDTMAKFHSYSFNNLVLIAMQKPDATLVAGYNSWKNKFNRQVSKGQKGIRILAPSPFKKTISSAVKGDDGKPLRDAEGKEKREDMEITIPCFRSVSVFDVSQTEGEPLPNLGIDELSGEVKDYQVFFEAAKSCSPVPVEFEEIASGAKGYYDLSARRIALCTGMSEAQNVKTLIHEMSHQRLHSKTLKDVVKDGEKPLSRNEKEVQAESIAYVVCQHYGIDTSEYSFGYISGWSSDKEVPELREAMKVIRDTADELITSIDDKLIELERNKTIVIVQTTNCKESVIGMLQTKKEEISREPEKGGNEYGLYRGRIGNHRDLSTG